MKLSMNRYCENERGAILSSPPRRLLFGFVRGTQRDTRVDPEPAAPKRRERQVSLFFFELVVRLLIPRFDEKPLRGGTHECTRFEFIPTASLLVSFLSIPFCCGYCEPCGGDNFIT